MYQLCRICNASNGSSLRRMYLCQLLQPSSQALLQLESILPLDKVLGSLSQQQVKRVQLRYLCNRGVGAWIIAASMQGEARRQQAAAEAAAQTQISQQVASAAAVAGAGEEVQLLQDQLNRSHEAEHALRQRIASLEVLDLSQHLSTSLRTCASLCMEDASHVQT